MTGEVEVANQALGLIGIGQLIQNYTSDQSTPAKQIRANFDTARQAILEGAHWNFARQQRALTLLKDATAGDSVPRPWTYEYAYPADCAQARYVMPATYTSPGASGSGYPGVVASAPPVRFLVAIDQDANGNDVKVILTNEPTAELVFTKQITNLALFDTLARRALSAYLAHLVCMPLTADLARAKFAFQLADSALKTAMASNGDEGLTVIDSTPDWIAVRGFAADTAYPPGSMYINGPAALVFIT